MAITYPRQLINNSRIQECWFDLIDDVAFSPSGRGSKINLTQVNDFIWKGNFKTPPLERSEAPVWQAWHKSLRGGLKTFIAYDIRRANPYAYPAAITPADIGAGWTGTAVVTALGLSGAISLSGLPAAYNFKCGDRLGLEQNTNYGYYECIEDTTAVAGVATVTVTPFLHTGFFTTAAVCRVWRPWCQFLIGDWMEQGTVENTPITFTGAQRL